MSSCAFHQHAGSVASEDEGSPEQLEPVFKDASVTVYHGDCFDILPSLPDGSVQAVVTDPPYGLGFMGNDWDRIGSAERGGPAGSSRPVGRVFGAWCEQWARECLRLLTPGGHLIAFGGTRMWHRLVVALEDAGFEIRDSIAWLYGQGFPKSLDVPKALDREAVAGGVTGSGVDPAETTPMAAEASRWRGWGTGLKPAFEPIIVARRPLAGTVAATVRRFGTGALHIDACRVPATARPLRVGLGCDTRGKTTYGKHGPGGGSHAAGLTCQGRWPPNVVLSHAESCSGVCADNCPAAVLDAQSGILRSGANPARRNSDVFRDCYGRFAGNPFCQPARGADSGGAARFFPAFRWQAKAPRAERPHGNRRGHPTVKPLELVRWLVRLVTPAGGLVLDPFLGSGTTAEAARLEGTRCIGIEREAEYLPLIRARLGEEQV